MTQLTTTQVTSLESKIYDLLMQNPEAGMDEMGNCTEAASDVVANWIQENNIQVIAED